MPKATRIVERRNEPAAGLAAATPLRQTAVESGWRVSNSTYIVALIAVLVIWSIFGKRILASFLLSSAAKGALQDLGQRAIQKQPDWITLQKAANPRWTNRAAIEEWTKPLIAGGFQDAGVFTVDKMAGVKINILVKPDDCVMANVYEHPKAGTWIELVSNYDNGESTTLTTMKPTGIGRPPWITTTYAQKAPAMELVERLKSDRRKGALIAISTQRAPKQFEEGYAKHMAWQKNTGLSVEEVSAVVKKWSEGKLAGQ